MVSVLEIFHRRVEVRQKKFIVRCLVHQLHSGFYSVHRFMVTVPGSQFQIYRSVKQTDNFLFS